MRFTNSVLNWANGSARDLLERCSLTIAHCRLATDKWGQILCRLDQKQRRSVNRQYRYVRGAIINFLYLLIRNAARFIITSFSRVDADLPPPRGFVTGAVCGAEAPAKQRGELVADTFRRGHGVGRSQNW